MLNENFSYVSALILFFGSIGYFVDTIRGRVQPNRVTWFLWGLAPMVAFFAQIKQGVGIQSILAFMIGFTGFAIFFAALINRKANWKIGTLDIICGILSFLGIVLWQLTNNPNIAIIFSILSDFLAAVPTFVKGYIHPESESSGVYYANSISALITLLTVKTWIFGAFGFPLYIFLNAGSMGILVQFKLGKKLNNFTKLLFLSTK